MKNMSYTQYMLHVHHRNKVAEHVRTTLSQEKQKLQQAQLVPHVPFKVGDLVWRRTTYAHGESKKLLPDKNLYEIVQQYDFASYIVKKAASSQSKDAQTFHVHVNDLKRANISLSEVDVNDDDIEWEILEILNHRPKGKSFEYKVRWAVDRSTSWIPLENMSGCEELLNLYNQKGMQINEPRRSKRVKTK